MSLDTKYRPLKYSDVLGQDSTISVLKEIVRKRRGFHQSYVFGGAHGSGKTTLGRILARALLCDSPSDGDPCDVCRSCKAILAGKSDSFVEVDAATNSGKEDVRKIVEEASFGSFSGKRKLYLFDESHELSRQAMDALLKPLEDNIPGTQEKQIVCIFCTTEPEKMRPAILSRCAPAFRIRMNTPEDIAHRLSFICDTEAIPYEPDVLPLIAEVSECHIRDAIKSVEGISMLGGVTRQNAESYLHISTNSVLIEVLENLGTDISKATKALDTALQMNPPSVCYAKLADISILSFRLSYVGDFQLASFWDKTRLRELGAKRGELLLEASERFATRPLKATSAMLHCDISALHIAWGSTDGTGSPRNGAQGTDIKETHVSSRISNNLPIETPKDVPDTPPFSSNTDTQPSMQVEVAYKKMENRGNIPKVPVVTEMGVHIDPIAQNTRRSGEKVTEATPNSNLLSSDEFTRILRRRVLELTEEKATGGRPARRINLGNP